MKPFVALSLALASACAGTTSSSNRSSTAAESGQSCGQMVPAVVYRGSDLFAGPDSSIPPVTTVKEDTPVCASTESQGFGFRKVKLANGSTGFVTESSLSI